MFWHKQRKPKVSKKALKSAKALKEMGFHIPIETPKKKYPPVLRPFVWTERRLEHVLAWLRRLALLEILAIISNVGILFAIVTYAATEKQRRDEVVFTAWQTITNAEGQPGSGGRIQALEFLNASPGADWRRRSICLWLCTWGAENLAGVNLSASDEGESIYLAGVNLTDADLEGANLSGADLWEANLSGADLEGANLTDTNLWRADLSGTDLWEANLSGADLEGANLTDTNLWEADLSGADLWAANLSGADINYANLSGADLRAANLTDTNLYGANLSGADLRTANLSGAYLGKTDLKDANLYGADLTTIAHFWTVDLASAKLCKVVLPEDIAIDPDRDCSQ